MKPKSKANVKETANRRCLRRVVRPLPKPTYVNKCEGWSFDYSFIMGVTEECRKLDVNYVPSMEGVDDVLKVLKKRGHILVA